MQTVVVEISEEGDVKVDANGVTGSGCQALTKGIEQALGRVAADVKKPEVYRQAEAHAGNRVEHQR